jgi:ubiquinone/menaquinone biosynthesis C-methylase UbiE
MQIIEQSTKLSENLARRFAHYHTTVGDRYPKVVGSLSRPESIIVDVGGGRSCAFAQQCENSTIIAVDISADELALNNDVQDRRVGDVTNHIPVDDLSVDVVASRFVAEHLHRTDLFIAEAFRALRPGGVFVTLFPNKRAPFSIINRALPKDVALKIAYALRPAAKESGVFPAFYHLCSPGQFKRACLTVGFSDVKVEVDYFQSGYFYFCLPLAAMSLCYEWALSKMGLEALSSLVLVVATK